MSTRISGSSTLSVVANKLERNKTLTNSNRIAYITSRMATSATRSSAEYRELSFRTKASAFGRAYTQIYDKNTNAGSITKAVMTRLMYTAGMMSYVTGYITEQDQQDIKELYFHSIAQEVSYKGGLKKGDPEKLSRVLENSLIIRRNHSIYINQYKQFNKIAKNIYISFDDYLDLLDNYGYEFTDLFLNGQDSTLIEDFFKKGLHTKNIDSVKDMKGCYEGIDKLPFKGIGNELIKMGAQVGLGVVDSIAPKSIKKTWGHAKLAINEIVDDSISKKLIGEIDPSFLKREQVDKLLKFHRKTILKSPEFRRKVENAVLKTIVTRLNEKKIPTPSFIHYLRNKLTNAFQYYNFFIRMYVLVGYEAALNELEISLEKLRISENENTEQVPPSNFEKVFDPDALAPILKKYFIEELGQEFIKDIGSDTIDSVLAKFIKPKDYMDKAMSIFIKSNIFSRIKWDN